MFQPHQKWNVKARGSTAGGSKKKGKNKASRKDDTAVEPIEVDVAEKHDVHDDIHFPKTKEEKDEDRRERLREELVIEENSRMNTKKKKRLEKYIEKKLKKEERGAIFERLAETQAQLPTTMHLQSSSTLGTGRVSTNRERLEKEEDKQVRRAILGKVAGKRKREAKYDVVNEEDEEEDLDEDGRAIWREDQPDRSRRPAVEIVQDSGAPPTPAAPATKGKVKTIGGALQRNADGTVVMPKMLPRKQKGKQSVFSSWKHKAVAEAEADSDTSFDSSDSANDPESGNDEDSDESGSESEVDAATSSAPKRKLGFKDWATKQLGAARGWDPAPDPDAPPPEVELNPQPTKKRKVETGPREMRGPLGEDLILPDTSLARYLQETGAETKRKGKYVFVSRPPEVEEARLLLPIVSEEQPIMEAVLLNTVVVICGETGSGKTTQVPQFLYEAGFGSPDSDNPGMIGITQPRRVAAMSMASRVAHELSLTSSKVSYQIRYDATVSSATSIKFMTDGVLLRELATDFLLTKYSVIIIDEAHERSMNTDILIGVLSRVLKLREDLWKQGKAKPLRLIIMSATLRVSDFAANTTLFPSPPPVINVSARQHPVTVHFSRKTTSDYVTESVKKASKIHARLPPGGILIFLTGQHEIVGVCKKLEAKFGFKALGEKRKRRRPAGWMPDVEEGELDAKAVAPAHADVEPEDVDLGTSTNELDELAFDVDDDMGDDDPDALDSDDEGRLDEELGLDSNDVDAPMHIVPLYSLLPSDKQMKVFQPPPEGHRLVVVATNVAETSLTIPGIRYVIDCGRAKERRYDIANGIQNFQVSWISKASASQRSGRAGRTGPGHCYRLFSSALFEHHFEAFSQPEILRMPIEGVVLQMKSMHIDAVVNFPFPTPPDRMTLRKAETILTHLGAMAVSSTVLKGSSEVLTTATIGGQVTELGKAMSLFPLSPRFSRMLVSGRQQGCLPYVISVVAALSVGDPFLREEGLDAEHSDDEDADGKLSHLTSAAVKAKEARKLRRKSFFSSQQTHISLGSGTSDMFRILSVVGAYEYAGGGQKFCADHFVRPKAMEEIHKLRSQISSIVQVNFPSADSGFVSNLRPPNDLQLKVLRQLLTAGFIDQVAVRKDHTEKSASTGVQYATTSGVAYKAMGISEDVFIHPSSVLANASPPDYVVFHEVVRTSRVWIKGVTVVNPAWLSSLGQPSLCTLSKPTKNAAGVMMSVPRFGPEAWELPAVCAEPGK